MPRYIRRQIKKTILLSKKIFSLEPKSTLSVVDIHKICEFRHDMPQVAMGPHWDEESQALTVRAFNPRATELWLELGDASNVHPMKRIDDRGLYEVRLEMGCAPSYVYRIGFKDASGYTELSHDPYAFTQLISDYDLYLLTEGEHFHSYEKLGAHVCEYKGVSGVRFALWAPNARAVSVIGDFNHWRAGAHPMMKISDQGFWALFIPGLDKGQKYKFAIRTPESSILEKADPYAFASELRPCTGSVVCDTNHYAWGDSAWMTKRQNYNFLRESMSIYELHLGSFWRQGPNGSDFVDYRSMTAHMIDHVKKCGYTHVELMPVAEHPLDASWGYQVISYFAPTSRFGSPEDLQYLIDQCHQHDIGVIVDWVPAHFPKDDHGLNNFDGRQIYAYEDWRKGEHRDWGTLVFDYGRREVRNFLISNALYWLERFHIDGLRVDAVASMLYLDYSRKDGEWTPNQFGGNQNLEAVDFIKRFNEIVHGRFPGVVTIAEESTSWPAVSRPTYAGGLGFSMKWNMGWMHDTLEYFQKNPIHRKYHQGLLTFSFLYAFTENFILPISHDEVVYGKRSLLDKMPGDDWQKFANMRLFLAYMFAHPGKKLLFMGSDIAQRDEWNFDKSVDWHLTQYAPHQQLRHFCEDLNKLYRRNSALHEVDFDAQGFEWVDFSDYESSVISFIRWNHQRSQLVLACFNMTPVPREGYRVGVPYSGEYQEILNSDASYYGGSGIGNLGRKTAELRDMHGRAFSIEINIPPLAAVYFLKNLAS